MKKLFSVDTTSKNADIALLIGRFAIAAMMLVHGLPKLGLLLGDGPVQFMNFMGLGPALSLSLVVFAEVFCSLLILVGFGTRLVTIPLIITMLVAVFYAHAADPFAKKEMALHYLLTYVMLLIMGSGKFSLDYYMQSKQSSPALQRA
jgi:putative oxidoreductase